jgi:hypothetical protein
LDRRLGDASDRLHRAGARRLRAPRRRALERADQGAAHHAASLGGEREHVEGLLQGSVHVASPGQGLLAGWYRPAEVLDQTFGALDITPASFYFAAPVAAGMMILYFLERIATPERRASIEVRAGAGSSV